MNKQEIGEEDWIEYYNHRDILDEITYETVEFSMDENLRHDILFKKRKRKLKNITIKMDPLNPFQFFFNGVIQPLIPCNKIEIPVFSNSEIRCVIN